MSCVLKLFKRVSFLKTIPCISHFHTESHHLAKYWQIYFDFQYYLLCCPFRLKFDDEAPSTTTVAVDLSSWTPHTALCSILCFLHIFWMLHWIRDNFPKNHNNPTEYLALATEICISLVKVSLIKIYWLHRFEIHKIVQFTGYICNFPHQRNFFFSRFGRASFPTLCLILTLASSAWVPLELMRISRAGQSWWETIVRLGRTVFFFEDLAWDFVPTELSPVAELALVIVTIITQVNNTIYYCSVPLAPLLPTMILWPLATGMVKEIDTSFVDQQEAFTSHFVIKMQSEGRIGWLQLKKHFQAMKALSSLVNKTFGFTITSFILEVIFYFSMKFDEYFNLKLGGAIVILNQIYLLAHLIPTCGALMLCGDISIKVRLKWKVRLGKNENEFKYAWKISKIL